MKIWLVNPFDSLPGEYFREGRYASLSRILVKDGHRVVWWTSDFFHVNKAYRTKNTNPFEGCHVNYIHVPMYKKNVSFSRLFNHWVYGKNFLELAEQTEELPDVIIASCPPIKSAANAIKFAHKYNIKCIVDIQDLWPELFEMVFPFKVGKLVLFPLKKYVDNIYNSADAIMTVSQTYKKRAISACKKEKPSFVLYLGVDLELFGKVDVNKISLLEKKKKGQFWVTYIGTIGRCYDVKTILNTAESLKVSHRNIRFLIAGNGPQLNEMKTIVKNKNLTNCRLLGFINFENMVALLKQSDIGLNAYVKKAKNSFPNKVFDYMAAGLPIISSITGELENLLKAEQIGMQYTAGNAVSLTEAVLYLYKHSEYRRLLGENAQRFVKEKFDRGKEYSKVVDFLQNVVDKGKKE